MFKFTVPKPCHQNWENMLPEEKGRFCTSCQTKVYDFSKSTDEEIEEIYDLENGNICGRFQPQQVVQYNYFQNKTLKFANFTHTYFSKFGIVIALATTLLNISGCTKKAEKDINDKGKDVGEKNGSDSPNSATLGGVAPIRKDSAQFPEPASKDSFPQGKVLIKEEKDPSQSNLKNPKPYNNASNPLGKIAPTTDKKANKSKLNGSVKNGAPSATHGSFPVGKIVPKKNSTVQPIKSTEEAPHIILGKPARNPGN